VGKYTNVAAGLTPKPEETAWQAEVTTLKRSLLESDPSQADLAKDLLALRAEKDRIREALSAINLRVGAVEQLIADSFEASGITQVRLDSGDTISTQIKPFARVADRAAFRAWCITNGLEDSLQLPWQSTNALVSDRLIDGLDEPDGIETYKQTTVVLRRSR
jgi:septal ring factor EnvC (AmiA/AmiB activator)